MKILIRADASNARGMGHISKQITLYNRLRLLGHEILFVTKKNKHSLKILELNSINYICFDGDKFFDLGGILNSFKARIILLDILNTTCKYIEGIKNYKIKIVTFDNSDESSFMCDIIFNIMYYHKLDVKKKYNNLTYLYEGYKYIIIDDAYHKIHKNNFIDQEVTNILLTQGGADTLEKVPLLLNILLSMYDPETFNINVVVGRAFSNANILKINNIASKNENIILHNSPDGIAELINNSDLVITAGGTTMWEIASLNIPMYIYINEEFEDETASIVEKLGFAIYQGIKPADNVVASCLKELIKNYKTRKYLHNNMKKSNLSEGLNSVVEIIEHECASV
jgi:spore coat polysaccharide biosynthesis predicted glycosyltransferase SpsG